MNGWAGCLLDVDLTRMTVKRLELTPEMTDTLGGIGISTRIVTQSVPPGADPLGPENVLCFAVGSFVGTHVPTACRTEVSAKSPATGLFGTSNSGAYWGSELKAAGFDGVILRGAASAPVQILVRDGEARIACARSLWGKDSWETVKAVREAWGDQEAQVAAIGQGGETLCRFASIQNGPYDAWGRTGLGAVMGAKKVKAIAVRGTAPARVFNKARLLDEVEKCREAIAGSPFFAPFAKFGTMLATVPYHEFGALPGRNFQQGQVERWLETRSRHQVHQYTKRGISCITCPIACAHWVEVKEGPYSGLRMKDMEVTPVIGFGAGCDVDNLPAIAKLSEMCQRYGIDMVSAAATVAFATELYQRGLLTEADIGFPLAWGDEPAVFALLERIVRREGIGDVLAEGTKRAGERIPGAAGFAMHVKGLEIPMADARARWSTWTFGQITNIRGGDHLRNRNPVENLRFNAASGEYRRERFGLGDEVLKNLDMPEKMKERLFDGDHADIPRMSKWAEDLITVYNSVGLCIRPPVLQSIGPERIARVFSAVTGRETTAAQIMLAGERTWNRQKLFNLACGEETDQSAYPDRFYREPMPAGPSEGRILDREKVAAVLAEYYRERGWDAQGRPTPEKLTELFGAGE